MGEKMARAEITPGAGAPSQAETEKKELPSRRKFILEGGSALALTLLAAKYFYPVAQAYLENIASREIEEVLASDESLAIQEATIEDVNIFLQGLGEKVDEIYKLRSKRVEAGEPYVVKMGDTLPDIAERYKVSVDTILHLNLNITNPKTISPGQEIKMPRPEDSVPSEALGEIFSRVENDLTRIQGFVGEGQEDSLEARATAKEIMEYWNIAPGEQGEVRTPEIIVNPKAERGEWIASQLREFLGYLPNSGRVVEKIFIEPRETWPDWPHGAGMFSFKDHGAHIWIFSELPLGEKLTRKTLLKGFSHEFSHGASLYSKGYNLRFIPPAEVVNLVYEDTLIWERRHQSLSVYWPVDEEEINAWIVPIFILGEEKTFYATIEPEIVQAKLEFGNHWFSEQLGEKIDLIKLGEQIGFRRAKTAKLK